MERFEFNYDAKGEALSPSLMDYCLRRLCFRSVPFAGTENLRVRWPTNQQERYLAGGWLIVEGKFPNGMPCAVDDTLPADQFIIEDAEAIATITNLEVL